jgi:uncharacterized protein YaaN involved in tellurite resistance
MSILTDTPQTLTATPVNPKTILPKELSPADLEQVTKLKLSLDPTNTNSLITYGVGAQKEISDFTGQILEQVKAKDVGVIGDILSELSLEVKKVDTNALIGSDKNILSAIPGVGFFFDKLKQFQAKYSSIEQNINTITDKLDSQYDMLLRDVIMFDNLYTENVAYYSKLNLIIVAGNERVAELTTKLAEDEKQFANSDDQLKVQEIQQLRTFIDQLELRVHDLELTRISTIQSFPQIAMIKASDQGLASKVQSAILNTIPLWKRHITIAIGLYNQKVVIEDLKKVDDVTDKLLQSNSAMMKENSVEIAKSLQKGIVSIETLEIVQKNLIDSIDQVRAVVVQGKADRQVAKAKIETLETELKQKLATVK